MKPVAMSRQAERTRGLRSAAKLTAPERAVIDAIRWLTVRGGTVRAWEIGQRTGQSEQGAAQTASSCVRKGLVTRTTGRGHVWFALTAAGWAMARPRTQQPLRPPESVTAAEATVLRTLAGARNGLTLSAVREVLHIDAATAMETLVTLTTRGLAAHRRGGDQRNWWAITPGGRRAIR